MRWWSGARECARCFSLLVAAQASTACSSDSKAHGPTWYRDVQPIVQQHCASCHDAGGPGPVNLTFPPSDPALYEKSKTEFSSIVGEVDFGDMPYWPADTACRHYQHERRLSPAEIHTFDAWLAAGTERGEPGDAPAPPLAAALSRVDLELAVDPGYSPQKSFGVSDARCFVLDPALDVARDVVGFDIRPGSKLVQHAAVYAVPLAAARALDDLAAGVGYPCFGDVGASAALLGEYVPGVPAQEYPAGTGIRLTAGIGLVLAVQYDLGRGSSELDVSRVQLEFADAAVPHPARFESLRNDAFSISAKASGASASATFPVSTASTLYGVAPHLLAYGRTAHFAVTQASGEQCLLDVANWDRAWEQAYFFADPELVSLAPGDSVRFDCTWDNPTTDALKPGSSSSDEACVGNVYLADD